MGYLLFEGKFIMEGKEPLADRIHFQPDHPETWSILKEEKLRRLQEEEELTIRLEGIDGLEINYKGFSQPNELALKARHFMLGSLGINLTKTHWDLHKIIKYDGADARGYITVKAFDPLDAKGQAVAFAFAGTPPEYDRKNFFYLSSEHVIKSVNYQLLVQGLVYPSFYFDLYYELRQPLIEACREARAAGKGFWPKDMGADGIILPGGSDPAPLIQDYCILPKLFRLLIDHFEEGGTLNNFLPFLCRHPHRTINMTQCDVGNFKRFIKLDKQKNKIGLAIPPESLLFDPAK